jgi:hypothetical protein
MEVPLRLYPRPVVDQLHLITNTLLQHSTIEIAKNAHVVSVGGEDLDARSIITTEKKGIGTTTKRGRRKAVLIYSIKTKSLITMASPRVSMQSTHWKKQR